MQLLFIAKKKVDTKNAPTFILKSIGGVNSFL